MYKKFPLFRPIHRLYIGILLLENDMPYASYCSQYCKLVQGLPFNHTCITISQLPENKLKFFNQFESLVISGGIGHINDRNDLQPTFDTLQDFMKAKRVIGFCLAYQYQIKLLGGKINGNFGSFKRYISKHRLISKSQLIFNLYMAHQFYCTNTPSHPDITPILKTDTIECAAFLYKQNKGIFFQAHPECLLAHVQDCIEGTIPPSFKKDQEILQHLLRNFLCGRPLPEQLR